MDQQRIRDLLESGDQPSRQECVEFVQIIDHCDTNLLWKMLTECPKMNWWLRSVATSIFKEKALKEKSDEASDHIRKAYEALKTRFE